jgi:hypothetical protein
MLFNKNKYLEGGHDFYVRNPPLLSYITFNR